MGVQMEPIVTVYAFSDLYAEFAAVSMTSLLQNTKRECHIHIFEHSLSREARTRLFRLEDMYSNAKITIHHIPREKPEAHNILEEITDLHGKEVWYHTLAPEILHNFDKVLILDADTLICRDISELYDTDLGCACIAARIAAPSLEEYDLITWKRSFTRLNAGVMLCNLKTLREKDFFNTRRVVETVKKIRPFYPDKGWAVIETFCSYIFKRDHLIRLAGKYNSSCLMNMSDIYFDQRVDFSELYEAVNDPVVIHFIYNKPNMPPENKMYDFRYAKWWEYLSISPYANPERDKEKFEEFKRKDRSFRDTPLGKEDYRRLCLFDDLLEAGEKLKQLSSVGMKIAVYGAGDYGFQFIRLARLMNVKVDYICDMLKCGRVMDGIEIDSPEILSGIAGDTVVVIAIEEPRVWTEIKKKLICMGYPEKHILPVYEPFAVGGRKWCEVLEAVSL